MNPFQPPLETSEPVMGGTKNIELVATGQKMVIYSILINIAALVLQKTLGPAVGMLGVAALVLSVWGVYRLSTGLGMSTAMKVLLVVCLFIPFVNLITLLIVNSKATRALREAGYRIGLLGVSK